jgi:hypothetical protein
MTAKTEGPMRARLISAATAALIVAISASLTAQWFNYPTPGIPRLPDGKPNLGAPAPKAADGKPDLSGVWQAGRAGQYGLDYDVTQNLKPGDVTPWSESIRLQRVQDFRKDSPLAHCLPVSVPFLNFRGLSRIVQTPGLIVILYESPNSPHRVIFMDGRPLPKDPNPTWLGYSVGRWEQDTLVVDTIGFNDKGWLDVGGHPQTETLKITERFRRPDFGHLELDMTFDDPKSFAKPFSLHMSKNYTADTEILEDICENEVSRTHLTSGIKVPSQVLAKYAGTYKLTSGREVVVSVAGDQLTVLDSASPLDKLFVATSDARFLSSVSQLSIEFTRDAQGNVSYFTRRGGGPEERAMRLK